MQLKHILEAAESLTVFSFLCKAEKTSATTTLGRYVILTRRGKPPRLGFGGINNGEAPDSGLQMRTGSLLQLTPVSANCILYLYAVAFSKHHAGF